jgi:hypothetical protein
MIIDVQLEPYEGSAVVRRRGSDYRRKPAGQFTDRPAKLGHRQAVFYRNLLRLAVARDSLEIPVDFELPDGTAVYLDRGCIKIAEHAGFIEALQDDASGLVSTIRLALTEPQ